MVMKEKSSEDILTSIKENYEINKRIKYDEFIQKYFYRQIVTNEKQTEYKNKLKAKAELSKKRHAEAAQRRNALYAEKKNKIIARKQSRSCSLDSKSRSVSELHSSSRAGVYVTRVLSASESRGTAGFGKGFIKKSDPSIISKKGINHVNTSIYDNDNSWKRSITSSPEATSGSLNKLNEILLSTLPDGLNSYDAPPCDIKDFKVDSRRENAVNHDSVHQKYNAKPEKSYIIPEKQLLRFIEDSKKYRSIKSLKKVSFDSFKQDQRVNQPMIKKSLKLNTPETKKGILLKMSEVNAIKRNSNSPKFVIDEAVQAKEDDDYNLEEESTEKGDNIPAAKPVLVTQATNTEFPVKISKSPSAVMKETIEKALSNCGRLLQTRENEKKSRKLKLSQLHDDLEKIEKETKMLAEKNADVTKTLITKTKDYNKYNLLLQNSVQKTQMKSDLNMGDPSTETIESDEKAGSMSILEKSAISDLDSFIDASSQFKKLVAIKKSRDDSVGDNETKFVKIKTAFSSATDIKHYVANDSNKKKWKIRSKMNG